MKKRRITNPDEIAALNRALLEALELLCRQADI
jgi:hypothetical protein